MMGMWNLRVLELRIVLREFASSTDETLERGMWRLLGKGLRACRRLTSVKLFEGACHRWQSMWLPHLCDYAITDFAAEFLLLDDLCAHTVASWIHLRQLDLGVVVCGTGASAMASFFQSISVCENLGVLSVNCSMFEGDAAYWSTLGESLFVLRRLRRLVLCGVDKITYRIGNVMMPPWIRELALSAFSCMSVSAMCDVHAVAVAADWVSSLVSSVSELEVFELSGTDIDTEYCYRTVASGISSAYLRDLVLECLIDEDGVGAVCRLLLRCRRLVSLRLSLSGPFHRRVFGKLVASLRLCLSLRRVELCCLWCDYYVSSMRGAGFVQSSSSPFSLVFLREGQKCGEALPSTPEKRQLQDVHEAVPLSAAWKAWDEWFTARSLRKWFVETHEETCGSELALKELTACAQQVQASGDEPDKQCADMRECMRELIRKHRSGKAVTQDTSIRPLLGVRVC